MEVALRISKCPDLRSLTLKQLRALAATVERGSVSGAATVLHVTPPAISVQLKLLEEQVGAPLFRRAGDAPFTPTEIGAGTAGDGARTWSGSRRARANASTRCMAGASGSLVFGVVSTAKYLAPSIVAAFQRECPGVRVTLSVGNREDIIRGLERNEYDLTIMGRPPAHIEADSATLGDHPTSSSRRPTIAWPGTRTSSPRICCGSDFSPASRAPAPAR